MKKVIVVALLIITLIGCTTYRVDVSSHSRENISKKKYVLMSAMESVSESDLQFLEYCAYIDYALSGKGFVKVDTVEEADFVLSVYYGISEPNSKVGSYSVPTYGQTGTNSMGYPTYGTTGSQTSVYSYSTYFRFIELAAIDLDVYRESGDILQLWKTSITSEGSSGDLRLVFPVLVAAALPYIAEQTESTEQVRLSSNSMRIREIREVVNQTNSDYKE